MRMRILTSLTVFLIAGSCFAADPSAADLRAQGDKSFAAGDYDAAMTSFQAAAKLEPAFVGGQYRIAQTALRLKQPKVGLDALDAISLLDPKTASNGAIIKLRDDLKALNAEGTAPAKPTMSADDRLELDTLSLLYDKAQAAKDTKERTDLLKQFMDRSAKFVVAHPDEAKLWAYRGAIALEFDSPKDGWEAGKNIKRLGGLDRGDEPAKKVLVALNAKGWLAENFEDIARAEIEARKRKWVGVWSGAIVGPVSFRDKFSQSLGTERLSYRLQVELGANGEIVCQYEEHYSRYLSHEKHIVEDMPEKWDDSESFDTSAPGTSSGSFTNQKLGEQETKTESPPRAISDVSASFWRDARSLTVRLYNRNGDYNAYKSFYLDDVNDRVFYNSMDDPDMNNIFDPVLSRNPAIAQEDLDRLAKLPPYFERKNEVRGDYSRVPVVRFLTRARN